MLKAVSALALVVALAADALGLVAQGAAFEVASVRPVPPIQSFDNRYRPPRALASGRFDATVNLRYLFVWAYAVDSELIEGTFPVLDEKFVIAAKAPGQALLAQRSSSRFGGKPGVDQRMRCAA